MLTKIKIPPTDSSYLSEKLIAYIGNKRRLLGFIADKISGLLEKDQEISDFADLFAGSGSVSRLARLMGLKVYANDWELYSYILNYAHLRINPEDLDKTFEATGGTEETLNRLNCLDDLSFEKSYIARYYAPKDDNNPDLKNERLFYTSYNARIIDKVREKVEEWKEQNLLNNDGYYYLIASLLYEAATRANTSGVFKGFHYGFGGKGKDALGRIMKPIELSPLPLISAKKADVFRQDANTLVEKLKKRYGIVYLDPPYNQHQYGSNYHLLNTIALWDKPEVNEKIFVDGKKTNKSAIRKDWKKTKSQYCVKHSAEEAFSNLIENIDAKYIMMSYSTDGIIPVSHILSILEKRGAINIHAEAYTRYRGAKQSIVNQTKNLEYIFIADTSKKAAGSSRKSLLRGLFVEKLRILLGNTIKPGACTDKLIFEHGNESIEIKSKYGLHFIYNDELIDSLRGKSLAFIERLIEKLEVISVSSVKEQIDIYIDRLERDAEDFSLVSYIIPKFAVLYNKLSGKRAARFFFDISRRILIRLNDFLAQYGKGIINEEGISKIIEICMRRMDDEKIMPDEVQKAELKHYCFALTAFIKREQ